MDQVRKCVGGKEFQQKVKNFFKVFCKANCAGSSLFGSNSPTSLIQLMRDQLLNLKISTRSGFSHLVDSVELVPVVAGRLLDPRNLFARELLRTVGSHRLSGLLERFVAGF